MCVCVPVCVCAFVSVCAYVSVCKYSIKNFCLKLLERREEIFFSEKAQRVLSKKAPKGHSQPELGTFGIFIFFNNNKYIFEFFIKLIRLGMGFLNRTGAEIDY